MGKEHMACNFKLLHIPASRSEKFRNIHTMWDLRFTWKMQEQMGW